MTATTSDHTLASLERFAELPDWLAALMRPGRLEASLLAHLPEIADGRLELVSCRADLLRAKGTQWRARCRVTVAAPGSAPREVVLVGRLIPPSESVPDVAPPTEFGAPDYEVFLPDLRVLLHTEEADPALPSLGLLTEPESSARLIEQMLRAGNHPDATVVSSTPNVVRYKPGSRCTIVYHLTYDPPAPSLPNPVVAKTHQGDKGAVAHDAMSALWNTHLAAGDLVRLAEPLGYLPDERVLLQGPVPEDQTLKELVRDAFESMDPALLDRLRTELGRTAVALAALHTSGAEYERRVELGDWLVEVDEVVERLTFTVPGLDDAAAPLLARITAIDRAVPADPLVSAHHDFRPAQVLLGDGAISFIDFDGAAMAEPALDIGRFRGKLRDIGVTALAAHGGGYPADALQERMGLLDELCDGFLDDYRAHAPVTPERVWLWETVDLFTALLHAWTKVRLLRVEPRLAIVVHQLGNAPDLR